MVYTLEATAHFENVHAEGSAKANVIDAMLLESIFATAARFQTGDYSPVRNRCGARLAFRRVVLVSYRTSNTQKEVRRSAVSDATNGESYESYRTSVLLLRGH